MNIKPMRQAYIYNPQALQSLLTKLWDHHGRERQGDGTTSWESTHPGTLDRIGALDEKWKALPFQERQN
jgi:predicted Zn-dependent protease